MANKRARPEFVKEEHLEFLDELRVEGVVNMFGANPYIMNEFDIEINESRQILSYWMDSYSDRHPA